MSIISSNTTPNVYKLEEFVVVGLAGPDPHDSTSPHTSKTKPTYLECRKIYTDILTDSDSPDAKAVLDSDGNAVKIKRINSAVPYIVAVPEGLYKIERQGEETEEAVVANSLICPPYDAVVVGEETEYEQLQSRHIIYAQRLASPIGDTYGPVGEKVTIEARYVDVNAAGRYLKISSSSTTSNGVALTKNSEFQDRYDACVINEDSKISFLSDIDNVNPAGGSWTAASTLYALKVTNVSDGDATVALETFSTTVSPATKFDDLTDFDGSSDNTQKLNHASSETTHDGQLVTVKYNTPPLVDSPNRKLELSYLTNRNIAPSATLLTAASSPTTEAIGPNKKASHFIVTNQQPDSALKSALEGLELHEMMSNSTEHGIYNHDGAIEKFYNGSVDRTFFLTVETDGNNELAKRTRFKTFTHLDQARGVNFYSTQTGTSPLGEGESKAMYAKVFGSATGTHGVTFRPSKLNDPLNLQQLRGGAYKLYRENNGLVELVDFPAESIESAINAGGGSGGGTVKWNGGSGASANANGTVVLGAETPHPVDDDSNPANISNTATANLKLTYAPTLFGICKDDGSYEYRYFLTSRALTEDELGE